MKIMKKIIFFFFELIIQKMCKNVRILCKFTGILIDFFENGHTAQIYFLLFFV